MLSCRRFAPSVDRDADLAHPRVTLGEARAREHARAALRVRDEEPEAAVAVRAAGPAERDGAHLARGRVEQHDARVLVRSQRREVLPRRDDVRPARHVQPVDLRGKFVFGVVDH